MAKGWMVTFPKKVLWRSNLIDAFVCDANAPLMVDGATFPDAIAISGTRERPPVLEQMGMTTINGTIPELDQRPEFDPNVVWLYEGDAEDPMCSGYHHVGPMTRVPKTDQMEQCESCKALIGK